MSRAEHWEPPDPHKLLVSSRRVAEELDIPLWKANELCWSLERVFYGGKGSHYRVTWRSLMRFKFLREEEGLSHSDARAVLAREKRGEVGWAPYSPPQPRAYGFLAQTSRSRSFRGRGRRWS